MRDNVYTGNKITVSKGCPGGRDAHVTHKMFTNFPLSTRNNHETKKNKQKQTNRTSLLFRKPGSISDVWTISHLSELSDLRVYFLHTGVPVLGVVARAILNKIYLSRNPERAAFWLSKF